MPLSPAELAEKEDELIKLSEKFQKYAEKYEPWQDYRLSHNASAAANLITAAMAVRAQRFAEQETIVRKPVHRKRPESIKTP